MIAEPLLPLARPITEFKLLDGNPRRGDVASVKRSLQRFGQRKPIVVRADGTVEAGNTTLKAALELGWAEIAAVPFADDEATAKAFALADNRTSELGAFDLAALTAMAVDVHAVDPALLEAASFTEADLNALLAGQRVPEKRTDPDDVPEPPAEPVTQRGDLWQLGPHRLLCGDADDVTAHERLLDGTRPDMIWTDPPYGMNLETDYTKVGHGQGKRYARIVGDDRPFNAAPLIALYDDVREQFWWGADYYRDTIPAGGSWIVWDKRGNDTGADLDRLFGAVFELCWSRQAHKREIARVLWAMTHGTGRGSEDAARGLHPSQKPVALGLWFFERWPGETVLDLYAGAGVTLIAAHRTWRQAFLLELDPAYCDVICRRFQEHTGVKPVLEGGGPHDFTA